MDPNAEIKQTQVSEQQAIEKNQQEYKQFLDAEEAAKKAEMESETVKKYKDIASLGFLTKDDVEKFKTEQTQQIMSEIESLKKEWVVMKEQMFRARAQGINSGTLDQPKVQDTSMDWLQKHDRPKWK